MNFNTPQFLTGGQKQLALGFGLAIVLFDSVTIPDRVNFSPGPKDSGEPALIVSTTLFASRLLLSSKL